MKFIGEYLKSIRIKKKIKLTKVSDELKISLDMLKEIEADHFPEYLNKVFLIGHIKSYAKYLDLDHKEIIENFKIQNSYDDTLSNKEISKPVESINLFSLPKTLSYFSVIVFAAGFYFLFIQANNFENEYAMTPDIPENLISIIEEEEMNLSLSQNFNYINKDLNLVDQKKIIENESNTYVNSSMVIASTQKEQGVKKTNEDIILKFINATWIQIRDDKDEIIFSKLMDKGDEYSYNTHDNYTLTAGNAGNIIISLDSIILGKAGKVGEVVDSLIINKNLNQ